MQIVHIEDICARKAIYSEIPIDLSEKMRSALKYIGVSKFYSHQVQNEYVCCFQTNSFSLSQMFSAVRFT